MQVGSCQYWTTDEPTMRFVTVRMRKQDQLVFESRML